jgi:transposase-like protein
MLRGIATGTPTATLAREMKVNRGNLLSWRHRLQEQAEKARPVLTLEDQTIEVDEMYQNAGEKK